MPVPFPSLHPRVQQRPSLSRQPSPAMCLSPAEDVKAKRRPAPSSTPQSASRAISEFVKGAAADPGRPCLQPVRWFQREGKSFGVASPASGYKYGRTGTTLPSPARTVRVICPFRDIRYLQMPVTREKEDGSGSALAGIFLGIAGVDESTRRDARRALGKRTARGFGGRGGTMLGPFVQSLATRHVGKLVTGRYVSRE